VKVFSVAASHHYLFELAILELKSDIGVFPVKPLAHIGDAFRAVVNSKPVIEAEKMRSSFYQFSERVPDPEGILRATIR
jgi:hypothetical protein